MSKRTIIENEPGFIHNFKYWDDDKKPSWKRYGKGRCVLRITSHEMNKYIQIHSAEHSIGEGDKITTKETFITLDAVDGVKFYAWMKNLFEGNTASQPLKGDIPMPMTKVAIKTLNKMGADVKRYMDIARKKRGKGWTPSVKAMTLASYQMELDALNLAISALEAKL